jgi:cytochrome c oxidase subunit 2
MMARRRVATLGGLAVAIVVLGGCGNLGLPTPVTQQGRNTRQLWHIFVVLAIIIGAIVYGLIIFVVVRYRRRRGDNAEPPGQRQYNVPVEIVYTAIPLVIVGVLLGLSIRAENRLTKVSAKPDVTVEVEGFQWQWQFSYEGTNKVVTGTPSSVPVMVLPTGQTVELKLVSNDVVHSFWVPHFLEKRDLTPGVNNTIDVRITDEGQWDGVCSEFCGLNHGQMVFSVKAVSPSDFQSWLNGGSS